MKSLINKDIYKMLMKLYSKEFNFVFRTCVQIVTFENELPIKDVCLNIKTSEREILERVGEAIQKQMLDCEDYMKHAVTQQIHDKWASAIETHLFYLERIVEYLNKPA